MGGRLIDIPLFGSNPDVIQIDVDNLPDNADYVIYILKAEKARMDVWITLANEYHQRGKPENFAKLLEVGKTHANVNYAKGQEDRTTCNILYSLLCSSI